MSKYLKVIRKEDCVAATYANLGPGEFFTIAAPLEVGAGSANSYLEFAVGDLCYIAHDISKGEKKVVNLSTGQCTHAFPTGVRVIPVTVEATIQNRLTQ